MVDTERELAKWKLVKVAAELRKQAQNNLFKSVTSSEFEWQ